MSPHTIGGRIEYRWSHPGQRKCSAGTLRWRDDRFCVDASERRYRAFQYQWSPSGGTGLNATGLAAGTYSFTVRDGNNCVSGLTVTITEPPPLQASASSVNALCAGTGTGAVTVTTSGGVTPIPTPGMHGVHTTANATGLFAGTYAVTITDAHGCTTMVSATVQEPTPLFATNGPVTQVSCQGANDGTASVSANGGTSPYTFNWSPITNSQFWLPADSPRQLPGDRQRCQWLRCSNGPSPSRNHPI